MKHTDNRNIMQRHYWLGSLAAGCVLAGLGVGTDTVRGADAPADKAVQLPFVVFDEKGSTNNHYVASGWMGNTKGIKMDEGCATSPHAGKACLRFEYSEPAEWGGIVWQDPVNDWGEQAGGWNLTGAKKLKFWARGEKGGESVSFKFGVLGADKKFSDTSTGALNEVKLTKDWKEYTIELDGKDLARIKTGFVWTVAGQGAPVVFYLDDIRFE
jgi:hypothetical protein